MPHYSAEEMTAWSEQDVEAELRRLLPSNWQLNTGAQDGWYYAALLDEDTKTVWEEWGAVRRLLLLNAFGWLWMRNQTPKHPAWKVRTHEVLLPNLTPSTKEPLPDPEDVTPEEIRAVYDRHRSK